jgi:hypothetical protein
MYFLMLDLTVLLRQMSLLTVYDDLTAISRIYLADYNLGWSTLILCFVPIYKIININLQAQVIHSSMLLEKSGLILHFHA